MNLKIESNAYTKLEGMVGVSKVDIILGENNFENLTLNGTVIIKGEYYNNNSDDKITFKNEIPYEIVFTKEEPVINNIEICDFEYYEVAGRGIESNFFINVDYDITDKNETREILEIVEENDNIIENLIEEYKEEISSRVDDILEEKLGSVDDNFLEEESKPVIQSVELRKLEKNKITPTKEERKPATQSVELRKLEKNKITPSQKDPSTTIKVIYYKDSDRVKDLCHKHNLSYNQVLEENAKYDYNNSHRIIVSESNGCN